MKKILALSASPSKGWNSDSMLDQFIDGAKEIDGVEIEKIYVIDLPVLPYSFENREPDPQKEPEFCAFIDKFKAANGIVIATPTYNFGVPGSLKNLIDRLSPLCLNYSKLNSFGQPTGLLGDKIVFSLISGGTPNFIKSLLWFWFPAVWFSGIWWYFGAKNLGHVYGGGLKKDHRAQDDITLMQRCRLAGKDFARALV